jgi:hypothetical protein
MGQRDGRSTCAVRRSAQEESTGELSAVLEAILILGNMHMCVSNLPQERLGATLSISLLTGCGAVLGR